jgi:hypothetical protein
MTEFFPNLIKILGSDTCKNILWIFRWRAGGRFDLPAPRPETCFHLKPYDDGPAQGKQSQLSRAYLAC